MPTTTPITVNGRRVEVAAGCSLAAAAMAAGVATRTSVLGEARAPLCGMGICFECRATVEGVPQQRTCQMFAAPADGGGAGTWTSYEAEVLVVGAGPAGLAAAVAAAEAGRTVILVDDNAVPGGQIWRGSGTEAAPPAQPWKARALAAGVRLLAGTRAVEAPAPGRLRAESQTGGCELRYRALVIATGARERFLPFPGWTLPHVAGAGGLQALVKAGLPIAGKRVVVAGSGPLLLAVAAYLKQHGARVVAVCEQAPPAALARFALGLGPKKWLEGAHLLRQMAPRRPWHNAWPLEAKPGGVVLSVGGKRRELACDYLACGFHLVPNIELAAMLGCATQGGCVVVNERQETSSEGIYCAGEPTGIGGLELALAEGRIAGMAAAGVPAEGLAVAQAQAASLRPFAERLAAVTELRPELRGLARADTLICRCEDVAHSRLAGQPNWRQAKLLTRCGMGPCQGRVCGPACEFLFGWPAESVRPPLFPAAVATLSRE